MTLWVRLMARLGQVETRHWVAAGASVLLHLAVLLGLRQAPPPPPETVSFEIALKSPEELRLKPPKAKTALADKSKPRKLAKAKKAKPKAAPREPHTLEARLQTEKRTPRDAPRVNLPTAEPRQSKSARMAEAPATTLSQAPKESAAMTGSQPALAPSNVEAAAKPAAGSTGAGEAVQAEGAGLMAGGSAASSGEAGIALAASRSMALAPGGGDVSQGAQAGASTGNAAEGANAGAGPATFSASGGAGGGLNLAAGTGANANAASEPTPLAGGEPQGLRLTASGTLSGQPEFTQGQGGLAAGHLALEAGAANAVDGQGRGQALASAVAGGTSVSPLQGPAAGPGKGGQGAAIDRPAGSRLAGGAGPAPGRLAGAPVAGRSLKGPDGNKPAGNSSQAAKTLALAPGEPGSGPQWAVLMVPVQAGGPVPWGQGRGTPERRGGQAADKVATAPGGGDFSTHAGGTGGVRLARADGGGLAPVAPRGVSGASGGGGRAMAPAVGPTAPGGATPGGNARGMTLVKPAEVKVMRPDSKVETLDVLAPSNYCPLPFHPQPDNRPPKADSDSLELPTYAATNPSFVYPIMANVYGVEGKLIMRVQVLADGTPGQMLLKQSSGNGILDQDAREQLARWRFNPARKNGQTVAAWVDVPVTYRLPEGRK